MAVFGVVWGCKIAALVLFGAVCSGSVLAISGKIHTFAPSKQINRYD